jgi:diguanylate cyclase (GGDEF)-like protein
MELTAANSQGHALRILLIDDDQDEHVLLQEMMAVQQPDGSRVRFELDWMSSYEQALEDIRHCAHDVYLLDYQLGSRSGLELLREVRDGRCAAPIIMLTAHGNQDIDLEAMSLGAAGYLVKDQLNLALLERSIRYALERTQVQSNLQQLVSEREALQRATSSLLSTLDLSRLLGQIVDAAQDAIPPADQALLVLIDQPENRSNRLVKIETDDPRVCTLAIMELPSALSEALRKREALLIEDAAGDHLLLPILHARPGNAPVRSALAAPLVLGRELAGALVLASLRPSAFTEAMREPLMAFAATATAALQNAIVFNEMRELATTDPLTGIWNRRTFFELGEREAERAHRFKRPLGAIMFDVDFFKATNDKYGHAAGDEVLTGIVDRCRASIRRVDLLARYGGDEFAVLLPEADEHLAAEVANRIRSAVSGFPIRTNAGPILVSLSMGIAQFTEDTPDLVSLLNKADRALYQAKQSGRNTLSVFA